MLLEKVNIEPLFAEQLEDRREAAFVADRHVLLALIEDEVGTIFVDGVVGEVHAHVFHVLPRRDHVRLRCEPGESFVVKVHPQRVYSSQ